jgi:hypothetical protein
VDKESYSLFDGVILGKDSYLFIGVEDARAEVPNSHGIVWKLKTGQWNNVEINETLVACALTDYDDYYFVSIAETGKELVIGDSGVVQNVIATGPHSPTSNGPLTNVCCVAGREIFAIGTARQVYKKVGISEWIRQDQTCKPERPKDRARVAFTSLDGFSENDIYGVGWDGQIWHFNGTAWSQFDSPTTMALFSVHCCSNGDVYVCGQNGVILRGRDSKWSLIEQKETRESLRDIGEFAGKLYFCSNNHLYVMQDDKLEPVSTNYPIKSFGKLKVTEQVLLSIGLKDAAVFDGSDWQQLF